MILLAALIVAAAVVWAARALGADIRAGRDARVDDRAALLLQLFAPAVAQAHGDPRVYVAWQPLARTARQLFPAEIALLDRAAGAAFPFAAADVQAAHAQWTADWLAWERAHDAEYKRRAAQAHAELAAGDASARARIDAVEQEKLDLYQRRYAEYVRIAKALQSIAS
jgi:hypothetical protein